MTRTRQTQLMAGAAVLAMLAGAVPAHAFDEVNWIWDANVTTTIDTTTTAITELAPTGLNQAENEQDLLGDIAATSNISAFTNAPAGALLDPLAPVLDIVGIDTSSVSDLAALENNAQALGNSAAISSDVQINYDSVQNFGGLDPAEAGSVSADATSDTIYNASLDNSATAVVNSLTVDLEYTDPQNGLGIGNNVQTAMADVSANSSADMMTIAGFTGVGGLDGPALGSSATAIGNNFSVDVGPAEPVVAVTLP